LLNKTIMADKFFHEFIQTTSLKDIDLFLVDQNNETRTVELSTIKKYTGGGNAGIGTSELSLGGFLPAGTNKTFTVPSGISEIKIIAQGSGGNGGTTQSGAGTQAAGAITTKILPDGTTVLLPASNSFSRNGGGGAVPSGNSSNAYGGGGGAGGWCSKVLQVTENQIFTYTTGIVNRSSTIKSGTWIMTANAGSNPTSGSYSNMIGGVGGTVSGEYDQGYTGGNGGNGGPRFNNPSPYGGQGRNISGVLGGSGSDYSGYIYVMITK